MAEAADLMQVACGTGTVSQRQTPRLARKKRTYTALGHEGGLRAVLGHDDGGEESDGDGGELHFEGCLGGLFGWLVG